ncbi:carbohydrate porin [Acinetobacter gerneri]|uniref:carbohydrate porin n=1 Tax=Acinetobacter gerneri TaxID=202952 RepID=UPI0028AFB27F|nr:carbohydrate porin [Acinetobacter gerneri]
MKKQILNQLTLLATSIVLAQSALANDFWSQDRQYLLGDWAGERTKLEDKGYKFNLAFINETAQNVDGGYNDNSINTNASQLTLGTQLDLNKIAGWKDTTAAITITKRDGQPLTNERIADPRTGAFSSVQEIYGRGQSWRLSQFWLKKELFDKSLQVKIGKMGLSEDFNASHCEFQNLMLCGSQLGKTVGDVWYNWPVASWGLNAKYKFAPEWAFAVGIYELNNENLLEKRGFNMDMDKTKGAMIPVELSWTPKLNGLAGEYKVGAFYSTKQSNDVKSNVDGGIWVTGQDKKVHDGKHSIWLNAQQQLTAHDNNTKRGLFGSANFTFNDKATSIVISSQQLALWYKGAFDARPNDSIGLGLAHFDVNKRVRDRQSYTNDLNGLDASDYHLKQYIPVQHDELNVELNYTFNWSPSVMIRPNIQFMHQPGGVKQIDDAWVLGLTTRFIF